MRLGESVDSIVTVVRDDWLVFLHALLEHAASHKTVQATHQILCQCPLVSPNECEARSSHQAAIHPL